MESEPENIVHYDPADGIILLGDSEWQHSEIKHNNGKACIYAMCFYIRDNAIEINLIRLLKERRNNENL